MLPGFRFLFAALVLSMSALVFGVGAAALLRTAHEEFASTPALYAPPETRFAQASDTAKPVLALLRVDDPPKDTSKDVVKDVVKDLPPKDASEDAVKDAPKDTSSDASKAELPASDNAPVVTPAEQAATAPAAAESRQTAALQSVDSAPSEPAKTEPAVAENPPPSQPAAAPASADAPAAADGTKVATTEPTPPPASEPAPTVPAETTVSAVAAPIAVEQANVPSPSDIARSLPNDPNISTKIATLGGPPVDIAKEPVVKAASAKPATRTVKKHVQARREHKRRRIAARARVARPVQQPANPFGLQPTITSR
jgi:hypothetical protein